MDVYGHLMPGGEVADRLGALVFCGSGSRTGPFDKIELADDEQAIVWWPGTELNRRHRDFQSPALPTELPGPGAAGY